MCEGCWVSQYNRKYYVRCHLNPRHKQRQKFSTVKELSIIDMTKIHEIKT